MKQKPSYENIAQPISPPQEGNSSDPNDPEAVYRIILENISDTVILTDDKGNIQYVCPNSTVNLGLSKDEILNYQTIQRFMNGTICNVSDLKKRKEIKNIEWNHKNAKGEIRYLLINAKSVDINGGTILYVVRDITERKRAEEKLKESEERFRAIFEQGANAMALVDGDNGHFIEFNLRTYEDLGYSWEEFKKLSLADIDALESSEDVQARADKIRQKGLDIFETKHIMKDGSERDMLINARRLNIPDKNQIMSIWTDVTERKKAEQEQLAHAHFFESMDRVNRAMQGTSDPEQMMSDVLDEVLSIFKTDRAFLGYPCDPQAFSWQIPMERTRPEYPGVAALKAEIPMDEDGANLNRALLTSNHPVTFGPDPNFDHPLPNKLTENFSIQSQIIMAIYPREVEPWTFGTHQCSHVRIWTPEEANLLQGIGQRIADGLTSLLMYRKLRDSEEKYRRFMENSPDVIFRMAVPSGKCDYVSPAAKTVFGYSPKEWYDKPLLIEEIIHPDWHSYFKVQWKRLLKDDVLPTYEYQIVHKDGSTRWVNQRNVAIRDKNNRLVAIEGITTDITERKEAERELAQSKREWEVTFEAMSDWVALIDMDGKIRRSNPAVKNILGISNKDIIGKFCCKLIHGSYSSCSKCALKQAKKTWLMETIDTNITHNNKYLSISVDPVFNKQGQMISAVHIIRDITKRKEIENELKMNAKNIEEANTALKVLLAQRDKEKKDIETNFSEAINAIILPFLNQIRQTRLNNLQKGYLDILETSLKEVVKPYTHRISTKLMHMTPSETRIVTYIKQGYRIKEIASKLNISPRTVEFHRDNIRKKLGIKNRKINLRTYLLNIS